MQPLFDPIPMQPLFWSNRIQYHIWTDTCNNCSLSPNPIALHSFHLHCTNQCHTVQQSNDETKVGNNDKPHRKQRTMGWVDCAVGRSIAFHWRPQGMGGPMFYHAGAIGKYIFEHWSDRITVAILFGSWKEWGKTVQLNRYNFHSNTIIRSPQLHHCCTTAAPLLHHCCTTTTYIFCTAPLLQVLTASHHHYHYYHTTTTITCPTLLQVEHSSLDEFFNDESCKPRFILLLNGNVVANIHGAMAPELVRAIHGNLPDID